MSHTIVRLIVTDAGSTSAVRKLNKYLTGERSHCHVTWYNTFICYMKFEVFTQAKICLCSSGFLIPYRLTDSSRCFGAIMPQYSFELLCSERRMSHTSHKDIEQSTIEASITLDVITLTHRSDDHSLPGDTSVCR
jgi:hypothetical protein